MPHVTISLYPGYPKEKKLRLCEKIREDVMSILGADRTFVSVSTREVKKEDWKSVVYDKEIYSEDVESHIKPG